MASATSALGLSTLPLCENPLDRRMIESKQCRLRLYDTSDVVSCVDSMSVHQNETSASRKGKLHFMFIGDSRIRQQFYSFFRVLYTVSIFKLCSNQLKYVREKIICVTNCWHVKVFPAYDMRRNFVDHKMHSDMEAESAILNTRISFKWRPFVNSKVIKEITSLVQEESNVNCIVIGNRIKRK